MSPRETILVTGATSGIGLALAQAMRARGARVILGGRDPARLARAVAATPGAEGALIDITDRASIDAAAARFNEVTMLVNNAGLQRLHNLARGPVPEGWEEEIAVNLTGMIAVTLAFLPTLRHRPGARIVHVTSGLAFVPLHAAPVYSATKAAARAFTRALRAQLAAAGSPLKLIELIPPIVQTALHRGQTRQPARAMPLEAFTAAAMRGLDGGGEEVAVGLARVLRTGARIAPGLFERIINKPR